MSEAIDVYLAAGPRERDRVASFLQRTGQEGRVMTIEAVASSADVLVKNLFISTRAGTHPGFETAVWILQRSLEKRERPGKIRFF